MDEKNSLFDSISLKESSHESIVLSAKIKQFLSDANFFESDEDAQSRERVLGKLDFMLKNFVQKLAPDSKNYGGKIFTFGSYRLGVHDKGADIDVLCVVPRHVSRKDFFSSFYDDLKNDSSVSELSKVEDAYVPIINMKFHGIPIDLTFARLSTPIVKDSINILNDSILKAMDEKCILSLNGSRLADAMLKLVPNTSVFHDSLRAIKMWAKRRYVYGNAYGFLGGVAFSIAVAKICQMYPRYCAYDIIYKFFETYSSWKWPNPVLLKPVVDLNYNLKVWDPKIYPADKYHKMPVITPVYPSMCSTHNVTQSTFNLIMAEIQRAYEILKSEQEFVNIFDFTDFFKKYKVFIEIKLESTKTEDFLVWCGYIESKVRVLASKLENIENITAAVPFPKAFKVSSKDNNTNEGNNKEDRNLNEKSTLNSEIETNKREAELKSNEEIQDSHKKMKIEQENKTEAEDSYKKSEIDNRTSEDKDCVSFVRKENITEIKENEKKILEKVEISNDSESINIINKELMFEKAVEIVEEKQSCSFFIALEIFRGIGEEKKFYVDGPIREFLEFVNSWEKKSKEMKIEINSLKKKEVQSFLRSFNESE